MQRSILDPPDLEGAFRDSGPPLEISEPEDLEHEGSMELTYNWQLLRKFQVFWPRGAAGPPDFPWLGQLVGRKKAYYRTSQFGEEFADLDIQDTVRILAFISRSLTSDDPEVAQKKACCLTDAGEICAPPCTDSPAIRGGHASLSLSPVPPGALQVQAVEPGSPASAGVLEDDLVTAIGGQSVSSPEEATRALESSSEVVRLDLVRPGARPFHLEVSLHGSPLGLSLAQISSGGMYVLRADSWSPSRAAGVRAGDLLVSVDGKGVLSERDVEVALEPQKEKVRLELLRDGHPVTLEVSPIRRTLHCFRLPTEDGQDRVLTEPPLDGIEVSCPPGAIGLLPQFREEP